MKIGFDGVNGVSSAQPKLAAWQIHDVVFKGVEYSEFAGKKDPNSTWKVMRTRFEGKDGVFEETTFCPKDGDEVRSKIGERENPSNLERFQFFVAQLGEQLQPKRYEALKKRNYDFPADFERFVKDLGEVLKPSVGQPTKLKLIGNKKGEAVLPYFVNISKEGKAYTSNNFLGEKVFFTNYELTTRDKQQNAKPSDMSNVDVEDSGVDSTSTSSDSEISFDI